MSPTSDRIRTGSVLMIRVVLVVAHAFAVFVAVGYGLKSQAVLDEVDALQVGDSTPFTDALKMGITHTSEGSHRLAQTILFVATVLWGFILGKDEERRLIFGNRLSVCMTLSSNLVILIFLYCYHILDTVISRILFTTYTDQETKSEYIINLDTMRLSDLVSYQLGIFLAAGVAILTTLLRAHINHKEKS